MKMLHEAIKYFCCTSISPKNELLNKIMHHMRLFCLLFITREQSGYIFLLV